MQKNMSIFVLLLNFLEAYSKDNTENLAYLFVSAKGAKEYGVSIVWMCVCVYVHLGVGHIFDV